MRSILYRHWEFRSDLRVCALDVAVGPPQVGLRRPAEVMAPRRAGRCHGGRRRPSARLGLRHQLWRGCGGRPDHRRGRRAGGGRVRRLTRPGFWPDRRHGRGTRADRGALRVRQHRAGDGIGRIHRSRRRHHGAWQSCDVHPLAGDRGVHPRHRDDHLPATGARGVRHGRPRGSEPLCSRRGTFWETPTGPSPPPRWRWRCSSPPSWSAHPACTAPSPSRLPR